MKKKIKIGVVGAGNIFAPHAEGYKLAADKCEVIAVCRQSAGADSKAQVEKVLGREVDLYTDYNEMFSRGDLDAVDIITPHDLHLPVTEAAAKAKLHVLVEKVMARSVAECDKMIEACGKAGVSLHVCHDRRYLGAWAAIKELVDSGALGKIFYLKLDHNQNVGLPAGHWIRSAEALGGGALMSCLTHQIDALRWFGGEAESVACMTKTLPERMEGETAAVMAVAMKSGALANLSINWFTDVNQPGSGLSCELIHVCGDKGEALNTSNNGTWFKLYNDKKLDDEAKYSFAAEPGKSGFFKAVPKDQNPGIARCVSSWIDALRGEGVMLTPGTDSRRTVEVAEAAYKSFETRRFVDLPL